MEGERQGGKGEREREGRERGKGEREREGRERGREEGGRIAYCS